MSTKKTTTHPLAEVDTRLLERKLRKGEISREEYEAMLASLPESEEYVEIDEQAIAAALAKNRADR